MSERQIRAGKEAHDKKIGIHGLSHEQKQANRQKGNAAFLEKMKDSEFRKAHSEKIKQGKLQAKIRKELEEKSKEHFGFR